MKRTEVIWDIAKKTDLYDIAKKISKSKSCCAIVNLKSHKEEGNMVKIVTKLMTENDCYKAGRMIVPRGITIHSTAEPGVRAAD